jgi:cytochrome oxidase assembly protein ShyY1
VIVVAVVCVRLGFWQLDRLEGRRYYNDLFRRGMQAAPANLEQVLSSADGATLIDRRVVAEGRYDPAREMILYGRTLDDRPGNDVLTPLVLADGRAVIVDRGWVPFEMDTPPVADAAPPGGDVRVEGLLAPNEPGGSDNAGEVGGAASTFTTVDLRSIGAQLPYELVPWYVKLQTQTPAQPEGGLPIAEPPPELTNGPHLGYAIQWFSFATIAVVGWGVLVRREVLDRRRAVDAD